MTSKKWSISTEASFNVLLNSSGGGKNPQKKPQTQSNLCSFTWDSFWSLSACCQRLWVYTLMRQLQADHSLCSVFNFYLFHQHWTGTTDLGNQRHYPKLMSWFNQRNTYSSKPLDQLSNLKSILFPAISYFNCELRLFLPQPLHQ